MPSSIVVVTVLIIVVVTEDKESTMAKVSQMNFFVTVANLVP